MVWTIYCFKYTYMHDDNFVPSVIISLVHFDGNSATGNQNESKFLDGWYFLSPAESSGINLKKEAAAVQGPKGRV